MLYWLTNTLNLFIVYINRNKELIHWMNNQRTSKELLVKNGWLNAVAMLGLWICKISKCNYVFCIYLTFLVIFSTVVLQRSLHVEKSESGKARWCLGLLEQIWFLLTLLWNWSSISNTSVQQPSVSAKTLHRTKKNLHIFLYDKWWVIENAEFIPH